MQESFAFIFRVLLGEKPVKTTREASLEGKTSPVHGACSVKRDYGELLLFIGIKHGLDLALDSRLFITALINENLR